VTFVLRAIRVLLIAFIGSYVFLPNLVPTRLGPLVGVAVLVFIVIAIADGLRAWEAISERGKK